MARIRLSTEEIKYMALFESMTGATTKDCIQTEDSIGFLVKKGDMGLAIGKKGSNIERVKKAINKNAWVMEFSEDIQEFAESLFQPARIRNMRVNKSPVNDSGKTLTLEVNKNEYKKIIGPGGSRIRLAKKLMDRHFDISDIKVKSIY